MHYEIFLNKLFLFILFTFLLFPPLSSGTPQVPRTIVFQGILVDAGGNPLTDISSANANISIVDGAGGIRYEEQQTITLYQGATAFLVGMGTSLDTGEPTGGIPLDVMEPGEGDLILKIKIEGQTISQEDIIFSSVPFAFYSQYATELTQPIEADQIKDGAITVNHLSEEVTTYVKSLGVTKEEFEEHKTEEAAHTGKNIAVENTFRNLIGTNLQMLMESVDYNITLVTKAGSQVADGAITSSKIADGAITSADIQDGTITSADIADGAVGASDIDMSIFSSWDQNASDDLTTSTAFSGAVAGTYNNLQLEDNSVNTNHLIDGSVTASKLAESYLSTNGGTLDGDFTVTGSVTVENNITVNGTATFNDEIFLPDIDEPTPNSVNRNGIIKTWGYFGWTVSSWNADIFSNYNIGGFGYVGSNKWRITWKTEFSNTNYLVLIQFDNHYYFANEISKTTKHYEFQPIDSRVGTYTGPLDFKCYFFAIGDQ